MRQPFATGARLRASESGLRAVQAGRWVWCLPQPWARHHPHECGFAPRGAPAGNELKDPPGANVSRSRAMSIMRNVVLSRGASPGSTANDHRISEVFHELTRRGSDHRTTITCRCFILAGAMSPIVSDREYERAVKPRRHRWWHGLLNVQKEGAPTRFQWVSRGCRRQTRRLRRTGRDGSAAAPKPDEVVRPRSHRSCSWLRQGQERDRAERRAQAQWREVGVGALDITSGRTGVDTGTGGR